MFIFVLLVLFPLFNTKNGIFNSFFIGLIAAGDLGNMLDRFIFDGHVKDMFYTPFLENW
ncbi:Signal peptidase (SPase) II, partial [Mycoplasmopsis synoviae]